MAGAANHDRALAVDAQVGVLVHRGGSIAYASPALVAALGLREARALVGRPFTSIFHAQDLAGRFATPGAHDDEPIVARLVGDDGRMTWTEVRGVAIEYDGAPAMLLVVRDLTGERRARATRREHEGRDWSLFMASPIALCELDLSAAFEPRDPSAIRCLAVNEATLALFGATDPAQLTGALAELGHALARELRAPRSGYEGEATARRLDGGALRLGVRANALPGHEATWDRVVVSLVDRSHAQQVVLRELNHRIKNNLQVISSLLSLQSQHVADPRVRRAFAESQSRVHAIALVHDQLHASGDLARVRLDAYLQQLGDSLLRAHEAARRGITLVSATMALEVAVDVAIPCGLLVHELVANALQHAFPGRAGTITVTLERAGGRVQLGVADDGLGLPPGLDPARATTLGLGLAMTFAEQLGATLTVTRERGTAYRVAFDYEPNQ